VRAGAAGVPDPQLNELGYAGHATGGAGAALIHG
jgi:hypothetical protein